MAITKNSQIDLNGNEMILDADGDTKIDAATDDEIHFTVAGNETVYMGVTSYNASDRLVLTNVAGNASATIVAGTSGESSIFMADGTSGDASYRGYVQYQHTNDNFNIGTGGAQRLRIDSDGLKFGSDTAAANALDDYEQGTWTPTLPNGGTINTNYSSRYTKIGNVVYWHSYLLLSFANDSNAFRVTLPFNTSSVTSNTYVHGTLGYTGSVATDDLRSHVQKGVDPAYVYFHETDGTSAIVTNSNLYARNYSDGRVTAFLMTGWYYTED